jgi:transcriptional regulator with XRE-family HTH domain
MTFHEKLERLCEDRNRSAIERRADVGQSTIWRILKGRYFPACDVAARLASALGVDAGWFIDDKKGWPPVRVEEPETCNAA